MYISALAKYNVADERKIIIPGISCTCKCVKNKITENNNDKKNFYDKIKIF